LFGSDTHGFFRPRGKLFCRNLTLRARRPGCVVPRCIFGPATPREVLLRGQGGDVRVRKLAVGLVLLVIDLPLVAVLIFLSWASLLAGQRADGRVVGRSDESGDRRHGPDVGVLPRASLCEALTFR